MSENNEFKLDSGAVLLVTMAPFEDSKDLHDCVIKAFLKAGIKEPNLNDMDMTPFIFTAGADKDVERCLFKCAERAVYRHDGSEASSMGVSKTLFDTPVIGEKARKDYYPMFFKIAEVNLQPFMQALFSVLQASPAKKTAFPEQK